MDLLKTTSGDTGADAFLPVLNYVVIKTQPIHLVSNIEFIRRFRMKSKLVSYTDYYFTQLVSTLPQECISGVSQMCESHSVQLRILLNQSMLGPSQTAGRSFCRVFCSRVSSVGSNTRRRCTKGNMQKCVCPGHFRFIQQAQFQNPVRYSHLPTRKPSYVMPLAGWRFWWG